MYGTLFLFVLKVGRRFVWLGEYTAKTRRTITEPARVPDRLERGIELKDVRFGYQGKDVLSGVNLNLPAGAVVALVGENGAGKSTLVKLLTGMYQPDSGLVFHKGRPVRFTGPRDAQRHGVGVVHQEGNLVGSMSVAANLYLGDEPRNRLGLVSFRQMRTGATRLLDSLGIMVDPAAPVRTLDPAAQQMVAIARAVNTRHRVLVLDEPTSSLEPPEVATLFDVIRRLHEQDVAVLYASNRLADVLQVCTA
ncbi:ATP-binding cassette domain-containing protein, partial [Kibdelosporangium lantanae]